MAKMQLEKSMIWARHGTSLSELFEFNAVAGLNPNSIRYRQL
jgi:hypothetical protein